MTHVFVKQVYKGIKIMEYDFRILIDVHSELRFNTVDEARYWIDIFWIPAQPRMEDMTDSLGMAREYLFEGYLNYSLTLN